MRRKTKISLFVLLPVALVAVISVGVYKARHPDRPDFLDRVKTVAYTNLLGFGKGLLGDARNTNSTNYAFIIQNEPALTAAERALPFEIEAPADAYDSAEAFVENYGFFKRLAEGLILKGSEAESRGDFGKAADHYLSVLILGVRVEHGPVIAFLSGSAIEHMAIRRLKAIIPKLSTEDLCRIAQRIQKTNRQRITFDEILRREDYFAARRGADLVQLVKWRFSSGRKKMVQKVESSHFQIQTELEGTATAAAMLAYSRDNKAAPNNVELLMPKYLKLLPVDPYTDSPFHVLSTASGAVPYSVGPNKQDDLGRGDDIAFSFGDSLRFSK